MFPIMFPTEMARNGGDDQPPFSDPFPKCHAKAQVRRHRSMEGAGDDQSEELKRVLGGRPFKT